MSEEQGGAASILTEVEKGEQAVAPVTEAVAPTEAAPEAHWSDTLDERVREDVKKKGYKDINDLAIGWQAANKMIGVPADKVLKLPAEGDIDGLNELYSKLGRPESADGYEFESLGNEGIDKFIKEKAFENGLNATQTKAFAESLGAFTKEQYQAEIENTKLNNASQMQEVFSEWGSHAEANTQLMKEGGNLIRSKIEGMDERDDNGLSKFDKMEMALGTKDFANFLIKTAQQTGESPFVEDKQKPRGPMTKEQAISKASEWEKSESNVKRLQSEDKQVREAATLERKRLYDLAYN